jgi:transcriptional regulator with XRE-family HTH domain
MSRDKGQAERFAERLRAAMRERGHVSSLARSGVDVNALATAASISYEMARRYAEGLAIPRPDKLAAIAAWLKMPPGALLFGESGQSINREVLVRCVKAIREAQSRTGIRLSDELAAHLVGVLYDEAVTIGLPEASTIDLLLRAT